MDREIVLPVIDGEQIADDIESWLAHHIDAVECIHILVSMCDRLDTILGR